MNSSKDKKFRVIVIIFFLLMNLYFHLEDTHTLRSLYGSFSTSYVVDIILPCYMYLLCTLFIYHFDKWINPIIQRIIIAMGLFIVGVTIEVLQYIDIDLFGSVFDILDVLMYFIGIGIGIIIDIGIMRLSKNH